MTLRQLGVEEELLLIDPRTRRAAPKSGEVVGDHTESVDASHRATDALSQELLLHQVETMTDPTTDRDELRAQIVAARRTAGLAAAEQELAIVAAGTVPMAGPHHEVTPDDRYHDLVARFGDVARAAGTCGMHVHVDVDGDEEGVAVIDRVGLWLPLLLAISANSPYAEGRDTGYASWRAQVWSRWPTAGATQTFGTARGYHEVVDRLIDLGAARDAGNVYFDIRLAAEQPTVEIRVADVCTDVDDALMVSVLSRAMVDTALAGPGMTGSFRLHGSSSSALPSGAPRAMGSRTSWCTRRPCYRSRPPRWARSSPRTWARRWRKLAIWAGCATSWLTGGRGARSCNGSATRRESPSSRWSTTFWLVRRTAGATDPRTRYFSG